MSLIWGILKLDNMYTTRAQHVQVHSYVDNNMWHDCYNDGILPDNI